MAKKIKTKSWDDLETELKSLPATWYPQALCILVKASYEKDVFVKGGASNLVKHVEKEIGEDTAEN